MLIILFQVLVSADLIILLAYPFFEVCYFSDIAAEKDTSLGSVSYEIAKEDAVAALNKLVGQRHLHGEGYCLSFGNVLKVAKCNI